MNTRTLSGCWACVFNAVHARQSKRIRFIQFVVVLIVRELADGRPDLGGTGIKQFINIMSE